MLRYGGDQIVCDQAIRTKDYWSISRVQHQGGVVNFNRENEEMIIQLLEEPTYLYFDQMVMKVYQLPIMHTIQLSAVEVYNVRHLQGTMSMREREVDLWFRDAHYNTIGDLLK